MYTYGEGAPLGNDSEAYAWFRLAADAGDESAKDLLVELAKCMTPEQIARAQARSTELHKEIEARKAEK